MLSTTPVAIKAPTGRQRSCLGWHQEAALRMLMNNLDPAVAERPEDLIVYGGTGKAARDWTCFHRIVDTLRRLGRRRDAARAERKAGRRLPHARRSAARPDRQLAPRAALGDLGRVPPPRSARPDHVRPDDGRLVDLHRHPGHPPGHLRDVRRVRPPALRRHARRTARRDRRARRHGRRAAARGDDERRRLSGGRGRSRAASSSGCGPATATRCITILDTALDKARRGREGERRARRHRARRQHRRRDAAAGQARRRARRASPIRRRRTICASATSRTGCHWSQAAELRARDAAGYEKAVLDSMVVHVEAMLALQDGRRDRLRLRQQPARPGRRSARPDRAPSRFPGFVPAFVRPLFCRGAGPFRWVALSGDPQDIAVTDDAIAGAVPAAARSVTRWIEKARERVKFQGLPARICWLEYGERAEAGERSTGW